MGFNYAKLQGRIVEKCKTRGKFAKKLGISERTLSLKLNNQVMFKQNEIQSSLEILGLSGIDIPDYFFTREVQKCELV